MVASSSRDYRGLVIKSQKIRITLLVLMVLAFVIAALALPFETWIPLLMDPDLWRSPRGVVLFVLLYVAWNFALPPAPLQFLAGLHFGFVGGLLVIVVGTSLANTISHGLARSLGRTWVAQRFEESKRLWALEKAIAEMGWRAVVLLRLSNLVPSNLANLLMGITPLRLTTILWASIIGSLPGWLLMLALGQGGRTLLDAETYPNSQWILYGGGILAALAFLALLGRRAYNILQEEAEHLSEEQ